ncbi:hypothetical protein LTR40_014406, partial [Exophiala xenobiotica]
MSGKEDFEPDGHQRRNYKSPYTSRHPIPTVQRYRAERGELKDQQQQAESAQHDEEDESTVKRAFHAAKGVLTGDEPPKSSHDPYKTENRNVQGTPSQTEQSRDEPQDQNGGGQQQPQPQHDDRSEKKKKKDEKTHKEGKSATEAVA